MHGTFRAIETTGRKHGKDIELRPLHPNIGIQAAYRAKLEKLIEEMDASVQYWVKARYRNNTPLAMDDAMPSNELIRTIRALTKRWQKAFDKAAWDLADYFTGAVMARTDGALARILREGGFSVRFKMTKPMRDIFNATRAQNVALIKSIPEQYLKNVEGLVMRSVQAGRDMGPLAKALEKNYGVTKRRAAFIARSQNNLASGAMNRARQVELGVTKAKWRHSRAGKEPRPTHLANNGKLYDVKKGWYDPDPKVKRYILPGELPNCRCVSISVIPGFS
jgi:SPP1 gp7 family putative phage head morphogenesis protein